MCIICVSKSGVRQPGEATIRSMFLNNPHGAGYMVARGGRVEIHKGFMRLDEYLRAIRAECFTPQDSVVYHFRISTQAGVDADKSAAHYHSYACDAIIMHSARKGDTYRNENHTLRVESY